MPVLLADIGGTHARFALLRPGAEAPDPTTRVALDDGCDVIGSMRDWTQAQPGPWPRAAVLAVAGPVTGERALLTNRGWVLERLALAAALEVEAVRLVNDFAALAWGLPLLGPDDLLHLGGPNLGDPMAPASVIGPGTGLGVAAFVPPGRVLATEGGHAALAAHDAREAAVIEALRARFGGHVSAERGALSGQGIEALHAALGGDPLLRAPEIVEAGLAGSDGRCREAITLHCAMLGGFAGDIALLHGARGGVFLAGGIAARMPEFLARSGFRARFEAKGRLRDWVAAVPTWLIRDPETATIRGLAYLARRL